MSRVFQAALVAVGMVAGSSLALAQAQSGSGPSQVLGSRAQGQPDQTRFAPPDPPSGGAYSGTGPNQVSAEGSQITFPKKKGGKNDSATGTRKD